MVRSAVLVCVALLVAVAAWLLMPSGDAAPTMPGDANGAMQVSPPQPVDAPLVTAPADASTTERARVEVEATAATEPPIPDDAVSLDVLVVDDKTKEPVADAEAVWGGSTQREIVSKLPPGERDALYRDTEAMFARYGWHGRSDHEGKLHLRIGKDWTQVFVRAGTRYGSGSFSNDKAAPPEGHRVLLQEDLTVRVHVLDAAGFAAIAVPVSLDNLDADGKAQDYYGNGVATDDAGLATFQHVQSRQSWAWGKQRGEPVKRWSAQVRIPGLGLDPVLVDAQAPPVEPIEMRLPPMGRLKVKVTFENRPIPGLDQLSFHAGPRGDSAAANGSWSRSVDANGWARFGCVPLGKTLYVSSRNGPAGSWEFEVAGPTAPGQEVTASLELGQEVVALVGRLLEADGKPVASQSVRIDFKMPFMSGGAGITTDAQGRFVWVVYRPNPEAKFELKLERLAFEQRHEGAPPQRTSVPPRDLVVGRNDLGDLRFGVDSLVVGGHFVFDTPGSARTWFVVERARDSRARNGSTIRWEQVQGLQTDVQEDGAFQARGTVEPGRYRLHVQANNHLPVDPVEFQVGAADLRIDVKRGVPFEVECRLPAGIDPGQVCLHMEPVGGVVPSKPSNDESWMRQRDPLRGQSWGGGADTVQYRWAALVAGTYTLQVQCPGVAEPMLSVADIVLPLPAEGDPRLHPLDLRDVIGTLRVKVTVPEGAQRGQTILFFQPQVDDSTWQGIPLAAGETVLPVPKRPVDLLIASSALRPATVRGARDTVDVTLEPWPTVDVHCVGLDALPADLVVRVFGRDAASGRQGQDRYETDRGSGPRDGMMQPNSSAVLGKDGVASLPIGDGVTNLSVYLSIGERGPGKTLKQFTPNQIVAGAPVTVQLDAEELQSAIAALREQAAKK